MSSWSINTFYGFISRWKKPCLWMYAKDSASCLVMCLIYLSYKTRPFSRLYVVSLYKSFSMYSNTKWASLPTLIISLSFMILGWDILRSALTYDNWRHSSQVPYFFLSCLIATIYFVCLFYASSTLPKDPEPSFLSFSYFYISSWILGFLYFKF